jgi:bifunctional enzyme CysN/CysC
MNDDALLPGRPYLLKIGAKTVTGHGDRPQVQGQRQHHGTPGGKKLDLNEIAHLQPQSRSSRLLSIPIRKTAITGGFILIDRLTNATVGAGLMHFALRRAAQHPLATCST